MKTRQGFVSNSSSSSFVLFGCSINEDRANDMVKKALDMKMNEKYPNGIPATKPEGDDYRWGLENDYYNLLEDAEYFAEMDLYEKAEILDMEYNGDDCSSGIFLGFDPVYFRENPDVTFNQAIAIHTKKYVDLGIPEDEITFEYHEYVTYDG
jgi:hypothetical protein